MWSIIDPRTGAPSMVYTFNSMEAGGQESKLKTPTCFRWIKESHLQNQSKHFHCCQTDPSWYGILRPVYHLFFPPKNGPNWSHNVDWQESGRAGGAVDGLCRCHWLAKWGRLWTHLWQKLRVEQECISTISGWDGKGWMGWVGSGRLAVCSAKYCKGPINSLAWEGLIYHR